LAALADFYRDLDADVLCLQEVPGYQAFRELSESLNMTGFYAPGGTFAGYGGAILLQPHGWLSATFEDGSRRDVTAARVFERSCLRAHLSVDGMSVVLANLHLFSPRYAPNRVPTPFQLEEIEAVMAWPPRPDIVVGDLNFRFGTPVYTRLSDMGYVDTAAAFAGETALARRLTAHIFVRGEAELEVVGNELIDGEVFAFPATDRPRRLSDNCPVVVDFGNSRTGA